MENPGLWLLIIPALPLSAFIVQILVGRYLPRQGDWVSILAVAGSFVISLEFFYKALVHYSADFHMHFQYTWIDLVSYDFVMGIWVDNLTAIMLVIVTGVSMLIHFYSVGYMEDDPGYYRFFAFLSLFTFSMLGIVLTDNLLGLFIFWELVGLSSYFLIGFWYEKPSAANASKKAFLTTRVGDLGMFLGILMIIWYLGPHTETPLAYLTIFEAVDQGFLGGSVLTAIGIMLFFGAVGKSAQLPLHVWLPDAMEGPTPVSALIHAATMVAAGVYMVARLTPFLSPNALLFIGYVGAITAFVAASIALVKNDIKKGLAYSTVSQLGYMFLALGLGGYVAGVLHLSTHAIFKALLFLGSGSIIHAVHTQDMREMGGLWKKMPYTFITFFTATLAISGIPFMSGFYSKEKILVSSLMYGWTQSNSVIGPLHMIPFILGMAAAGMTAFYMFRMVFMTFFGQPGDPERVEHAHESPSSMVIPMCILAIFCFAFFFQAGPGPDAKSHSTSKHTSKHAMKQEQSSHLLASKAHAAEKSGHGSKHGKKKGKHGGGHGGWFEVLIQNPDPVEHYSKSLHHKAKKQATFMSLVVAGGGILLAATLYASSIWILSMGGVLVVLSLLYSYWSALVLLLLGGLLFALQDSLKGLDLEGPFLGVKKLLAAKYYFDEFYRDCVVTPTIWAAKASSWIDANIIDGIVNLSATVVKIDAFISGAIDNVIVDGLVNGIANVIGNWGDRIRRLQSGEVQWYLNMVALGIVLVVFLTVLV